MSTILLSFCLILKGISPCAVGLRLGVIPASQQTDGGSSRALLEQVDLSKDPTLRIFLRITIATYLRSNPCASISPESVIRDASHDFSNHEKEIPDLYVDLFRKKLFVNLKASDSKQAPIPTEEDKRNRLSDAQIAYTLLTQKGDVPKALEYAQRNISTSKVLDPYLVSFLRELDKLRRADIPKLLGMIMSAEESHPGFLSGNSFFTLKHLFVREQTPKELQQRYLAALINSPSVTDVKAPSIAEIYAILSAVLPEVQKLSPDLYNSAVVRLSRLSVRLSDEERERLATEQRINQSADPLAQLLVEADVAKSQILKDDLLTKAAQLSLDRGNVRAAIELVLKLRSNNGDIALWRDQFIEGAVESALKKGNVEAARYGSAQIRAVTIRSSALQKIALYFQASGDTANAREMLNFAFKLVDFLDDDANKAAALLDLTEPFIKVDKERVGNLIHTTVKTINRVHAVTRDIDDAHGTRLHYSLEAMKIAYKIGPAFQKLADVDQFVALDLAKDIQSQELKIAARLGVYMSHPLRDKCKQVIAPQ
jgi:hypothetical protein